MRFIKSIPLVVLRPLVLVMVTMAFVAPLRAAGETTDDEGSTGAFAIRRIVLLSCDTLSAPEVGTWGGEHDNSATLDSLATWGVLFRHCLTPIGWTLPAHMSMLTGLSPGVHRVGVERALPSGIPYLPEILTDAGFRCGATVSANGWMSPVFGFDRGFDVYRNLSRSAPTDLWGGRWLPENLQDDDGTRLPFFLFLHYMDVHSTQPSMDTLLPYWSLHPIAHHYFGLPEPPPEQQLTEDGAQWDLPAYDPDLMRRAYNACVWSWDRFSLGRAMELLREHDLEFDTLVIVTADHGEEFGQHGSWLHGSPYGGVRHVPLLVCCPGLLATDVVVDTPVSLLDLAPTILDLAGLPPLPLGQGLSLRPLLTGSDEYFPRRDFLVDGLRRGEDLNESALVAWEDDRWWSLVADTDTTSGTDTFEPLRAGALIGLYDLEADPHETVNLLARRPDLAESLRLRLDEAFALDAETAAAVQTGVDATTVELSEERRRELRALGY